MDDVYKTNYNSSVTKSLAKCALQTTNLIKVFAAMFVLSFGIFAIFPMYTMLTSGKTMLFLSVYIPYVDPDNWPFGYLVHITMQLIMAIYAAAGHMSFDLFLTLLVSNFSGIVTVMESQLNTLAQLYGKKKTKKAYRKLFLRNIQIQFSDLNRFVETLI